MARSLIRSQKGKTKQKPGIWRGFLSGSHVANLMIVLNVIAYYYSHTFLTTPEKISPFVLYPANLLNGNYWCFLTAGFLHQDLSHLVLNMLGVFIFGRIVERKLGVIKTLFIYLGALSISMLFSTAVYVFFLQKNVAIIGASGALMGLISAAMLLDPFYVTYEMIVPIPVMIKGWMFLYIDVKGFLSGETDGISHVSHLCGFLSVAILVYFLSKKDKRQMQSGFFINVVSFILFAVLGNWLIARM